MLHGRGLQRLHHTNTKFILLVSLPLLVPNTANTEKRTGLEEWTECTCFTSAECAVHHPSVRIGCVPGAVNNIVGENHGRARSPRQLDKIRLLGRRKFIEACVTGWPQADSCGLPRHFPLV